MQRTLFGLCLALACLCTHAGTDTLSIQHNLEKINLPPGFRIHVYAEVPGARQMALGQSTGTVFVGTMNEEVYGVVDKNKDRRADRVVKMMTGLQMPNGVAMHEGFLYVAENQRILRYPGPGFSLELPWSDMAEVIYEGMPDSFHHGWHYIGFDAHKRLYVTVGAPCNICETRGIEGTIVRMQADGTDAQVIARGIRNSVGFDFHPGTGVLHFTDNGADMMGDDSPPGEFNALTRDGQHFGFPWYAGGRDRHEDWQDREVPVAVEFPVVEFGAHAAALGVLFYDADQFPAEYRHDALVAQHGSWNRSEPFGYRIMRIRFDREGKPLGKEVFADGWLIDGEAWGRPVDLIQLPDGSVLVSDDYQDLVYRIYYEPE